MSDDAKDGTFLVTAADDDSAVLRDVNDGQVHTLSTNPGVERHDVVEGTVAPDPPMEITWQLVEVDDRRRIEIEHVEEPPTKHSREIAAEQAVGELTRKERAGDGEIHVITVPDGDAAEAAEDVVDDLEGTLARAARLGASRVEVRAEGGVVSVRYLP